MLLGLAGAFGVLVLAASVASAAIAPPGNAPPPAPGANVSLVRDIVAGAGGSVPQHLTRVSGTLFFTANDASHGVELWRADGATGGTWLVRDVLPGSAGSSPHDLMNVSGTLFFMANDGSHGDELWKSRGSASTTTLVKDINLGVSSSAVHGCLDAAFRSTSFAGLSGKLYFVANDGSGDELWRSDGTSTGTARVTDINPSSGGHSLCDLTNVGGRLFFAQGGPGVVWTSDGTAAGTNWLTGAAQPFSWLPDFTDVNGTAFLQLSGVGLGVELAKSDGTRAGTVLVKDIRPGEGWSNPSDLTDVNGTLFFAADDGIHGIELWKSNGTAAGTTLVKDIRPGAGGSLPHALTNVNGTLFFAADDGIHGTELWKSNGTPAGTGLVRDIKPGAGGSGLLNLTNLNGTLFFSANDGTHGTELWKSNGTAGGTGLVADISAGPNGSSPSQLTAVEGKLFFTADDGIHGTELWAFPTRQPDAQVKLQSDTGFLGTHVWNTTGTMQTRHTTAARGQSRTFTIRVQNDGLRADSFAVRGCGSSSSFAVSYRQGITDVTTPVTLGSYTTQVFKPGAFTDLTVAIRADFNALVWTTKTCSIAATSVGDGTQNDLVKAELTVIASQPGSVGSAIG